MLFLVIGARLAAILWYTVTKRVKAIRAKSVRPAHIVLSLQQSARNVKQDTLRQLMVRVHVGHVVSAVTKRTQVQQVVRTALRAATLAAMV